MSNKPSLNAAGIKELNRLRGDYERITDQSFDNFFCPILYRDFPGDLCRAHIINEAFRKSDRSWTIQRKNVDGFFGSIFESDFVILQERGKHRPVEVLGDKRLARMLPPKLTLDGKEVDYFVANGPVPPTFSALTVHTGIRTVQLGLKLDPSEAVAALDGNWQFHIERDVRLAALVSLLKAAHLTLFKILGYQYALSAGGHFLGKTILGDFFLQNSGSSKSEILNSAPMHFLEFVNMVRPFPAAPPGLLGTVTDNYLYLCQSGSRTWAMAVLVRTGDHWHAVMVPMFEEAESAAQFVNFMRNPPPRFEVRLARYEGDHWSIASTPNRFVWPEAKFDESLGADEAGAPDGAAPR